MTNALEITAHQIRDIINNPKPFLVFFKSEHCDYCKALEPVIGILNSRYGELMGFYLLDVNDEKAAADVFEDYIEGVPSVILFYKGNFAALKEPDDPDPYMWYRLGYLEDFIKMFLRSGYE